MSTGPITAVHGRALAFRGDDVDTDRIMPARFLISVSFEGLERHVFTDERQANPQHPFNQPRAASASILLVNRNFGCGSSREHAPQGLVRAGFRAIIGESFSEIFRGNSAMLGMPCLIASHEDIVTLQDLTDSAPDTPLTIDVASGVVTAGGISVKATLPPALRDGFLSGQWNPTSLLLQHLDQVRATAANLPYVAWAPRG